MTKLERSHAELRAAVLQAGRFLGKLKYSKEATELRGFLRMALKNAREVAKTNEKTAPIKRSVLGKQLEER